MRGFRSLLTIVPALLTGAAAAAPQYASIPLTEGVSLTPSLDAEIRYDDNIFRTGQNEEESVVSVLTPTLVLGAGDDLTGAAFEYAGEYGFYESSSDDNYDDHSFRLGGRRTGGRGALEGYVGFSQDHDDRGTGPSNGLGGLSLSAFDAPTEYEETSYGASVTLGNEERRGRIELGYDFSEIEYQNFRQFTRARDRDQDAYRAKLSYALTGKTDVVLQGTQSRFTYDFTPAGATELDSDETRILAGVEWQATGKTTGEFKLGWQSKDFDDGARDEQDGLTWSIAVLWEPRTYSSIRLATENSFRETDNEGDAVETTQYSVGWNHAWSQRLVWDMGLTYSEEDFQGAVSGREDDFYEFSFAMDYDWRRWMTLGTGVMISTRDSSVRRADFDRSQVFVRAQMSL